MANLKRICLALLSLLFLLGAFPSSVFSALPTNSAPPSLVAPPGIPTTGPTKVVDFYTIFKNMVGWVFVVAIILGVLMLIISGIMYMTAGGDQEKASKAMKMVISAMIGVAVAALAWALVNVIGNYFIGTKLIER